MKKGLLRSLWHQAFPHGITGPPRDSGGGLFHIPARYPVLFGSAVAGIKTGVADWMVQRFVEGRDGNGEGKQIDWRRTGAFALFGWGYMGYVQYLVYVPLFTRVLCPRSDMFMRLPFREKLKCPDGLRDAVKQVVVDSCVHGPFFYFPAFYATKEYVMTADVPERHETWCRTGLSRWKSNFWEDMTSYLKVWGPAQLFNFVLMPAWGRVPFVAFVSMGWTCFLSFSRGNDGASETEVLGVETQLQVGVVDSVGVVPLVVPGVVPLVPLPLKRTGALVNSGTKL